VTLPEHNPWGLSPCEARAMATVVEHGSHKVAANRLGVAQKTLERQVQNARRKMGSNNRLHHYLKFDRWLQVLKGKT
jgi:predicted DNA-binding protein (UPF0251 family)